MHLRHFRINTSRYFRENAYNVTCDLCKEYHEELSGNETLAEVFDWCDKHFQEAHTIRIPKQLHEAYEELVNSLRDEFNSDSPSLDYVRSIFTTFNEEAS